MTEWKQPLFLEYLLEFCIASLVKNNFQTILNHNLIEGVSNQLFIILSYICVFFYSAILEQTGFERPLLHVRDVRTNKIYGIYYRIYWKV